MYFYSNSIYTTLYRRLVLCEAENYPWPLANAIAEVVTGVVDETMDMHKPDFLIEQGGRQFFLDQIPGSCYSYTLSLCFVMLFYCCLFGFFQQQQRRGSKGISSSGSSSSISTSKNNNNIHIVFAQREPRITLRVQYYDDKGKAVTNTSWKDTLQQVVLVHGWHVYMTPYIYI